MSKAIVLDSAPVGLITNPKALPLALQCQRWFLNFFDRDYDVILPEIIDYEIRRELLRANKTLGLEKLDLLKSEIIYLPITTEVMLKAAELWSEVRKKGKPTADSKALDGDIILASQAIVVKGLMALPQEQDSSLSRTDRLLGFLDRLINIIPDILPLKGNLQEPIQIGL